MKLKPVLYLDLDGTVADFESHAFSLFGEAWLEELESPGWGKFVQYPNLFLDLPPMPDAKVLFEGCLDIVKDINQIQVLTAIPNRALLGFPNVVNHKNEWVKQHLSPEVRVHFGPFAQHKMLYCKHKMDVLVDDMVLNVKQWVAAGGRGVHHVNAESSLKKIKEMWLQE